MALGFNSGLFNNSNRTMSTQHTETAGLLSSNNVETAGAIACETAGSVASASQVDMFVASNPVEVDYAQYSASAETAGSLAFMDETAGSLAFMDETAGSLACETAGSVASNDCGSSFGGSDSGFVC